MTKSNQYSVFSSGDSISKNRKRECANEAQTLVVWAFSNVIQNWMRNRNTVEFLAVWEELHNLDFNRVQFEAVRSEAGLNRFVMTPTKWIEQTRSYRMSIRRVCLIICCVAEAYYKENKEKFHFNYEILDWDKATEHLPPIDMEAFMKALADPNLGE